MNQDITILRDLAQRYMDLCADPVQNERRDLWRRHNALQRTRPLIYVRAFARREIPACQCSCEDPFWRRWETDLRSKLFWLSLGDDSIFEPWLVVPASRVTPSGGLWGVPLKWEGRSATTAGTCEPPIKEPEDLAKLVAAHHEINEQSTRDTVERVRDAVGDLISVVVDRAPIHFNWTADISTYLSQLRGLEQIMWDMMDRPQWLHELLAFMRDAIMATHRQAEEAGDWSLLNHYNQAMPYESSLQDPAPDSAPVGRDQLWVFCASQEFELIGPDRFKEFMLDYQIPIMEPFALAAYGCCENLSEKIDVVRAIPNLRRIAISPMADVRRCAEQIGDEYVFSYRPSPSDMVGYSWDEDRVRRILREDLAICREHGCHVDITLKDVETVQNEPQRLFDWVRITREVIDEVYS
ncbi:MAG: hypothetical protein KAI66_03955 [Lentisphaeria bacterium]|nr:hypothetical protein [Lentisphaeria bacterium]